MTLTWIVFGLLLVPLGECRDVGEKVGIADPFLLARRERILHGIHAGEVLGGEIRIAPKLDALVEVVKEDVVQLVAGYRRDERHHDQSGPPEQFPASAHHKLPERGHRRIAAVSGRAHSNRQEREQRRQKGHGEQERCADPESDEDAQLTERRYLGKVHAQEAERGGQAREEDRLKIHPQRLDDRIPLESTGSSAPEQSAATPIRERAGRIALHVLGKGGEDVDAVGYRDRQHDDRCDGGRRGHREADPAAETHRGHDRQRDDEHDCERPAEALCQQY